MSAQEPLVFKSANEDWEFEQIHRLNYKTFVEEIPQHHPSATRRLVDKFHPENTYLICLHNQKLVGMLAVRGNRPFSLDQKLPDLDVHLPRGRTICEIRLLALEKNSAARAAGKSCRAFWRCSGNTASRKATTSPSFPAPRVSSGSTSTSVSCPSARSSAAATRNSSRCMSRSKRSRLRRVNFCARRPRVHSSPAR